MQMKAFVQMKVSVESFSADETCNSYNLKSSDIPHSFTYGPRVSSLPCSHTS